MAKKEWLKLSALVAVFLFAYFIITGNFYTIVRIFGNQIGIFIDQGLSHTVGMVNIRAEDNGFGKAIRCLQVFGNLLSHQLRTLINHQFSIIIFQIVNTILDLIAVFIVQAF